jgi:hypothetical protein
MRTKPHFSLSFPYMLVEAMAIERYPWSLCHYISYKRPFAYMRVVNIGTRGTGNCKGARYKAESKKTPKAWRRYLSSCDLLQVHVIGR